MELLKKSIYPLGLIFCLMPFVSSAFALGLGMLLALVFGNPYLASVQKYTRNLLAISVVGLGAGMNLKIIGQVGFDGIGYTLAGITVALLLGFLFGKLLRTEKDTSLLITVGTAICGGSAIAAVAPIIRAKPYEVSVSLGIVFLLNGIALFIFPPLGHYFNFSETQFGLWSALAIHDTSSVIGATMQYGPNALIVGTTVKLARALWIVPVALVIGALRSRSAAEGEPKPPRLKIPWFILGFLLASGFVTWFPSLQPAGHLVESVARRTLVVTLFLIGSSLTRETLKSVGFKPLIQGILLWISISLLSFAYLATTT